MRGRVSTGLAVLLTATGISSAAAPVASAGTLQSTVLSLDITPNSFPAFPGAEPTRIRFRVDSTYSDSTAPFTGKLIRVASDLSDPFVLNPQGFPQCDPASLANTTPDQALAACGTAQIGAGDAVLDGPVEGIFADILVFNATPDAGVPRIVLHVRSTADSTLTMTGTITDSPDPLYGQRVDLAVPILPGGYVFDSFDFSIGRYNGPNGPYLAGSCPGRWLFADAVYHDTGANFFGESNLPCTARPAPAPQNTIVVGDQTGTTQKGSELSVTVPGPGTVSMTGTPVAGKSGLAVVAKKKKPKPRVLIGPSQATATAAGSIALPITLTRAGLQLLVRKGKVVSPVSITFTPTGGTASTTPATVTIRGPKPKKPKKK